MNTPDYASARDYSAARNLILAERDRQEKKWGQQNHLLPEWMMILIEEVGELAQADLEHRHGDGDPKCIMDELIQVAAVAHAMVECGLRNKWGERE